MNEVKLRGKFLGAGEIKEVGDKGIKFRSFWIDVSEGEYPNTPELQLANDKCLLVDNLTKGMEIEVTARLKGRKAKDKDGIERVYTNIEAWRITIIQRQSAAFAQPASTAAAPTEGTFAENNTDKPKSGLPF